MSNKKYKGYLVKDDAGTNVLVPVVSGDYNITAEAPSAGGTPVVDSQTISTMLYSFSPNVRDFNTFKISASVNFNWIAPSYMSAAPDGKVVNIIIYNTSASPITLSWSAEYAAGQGRTLPTSIAALQLYAVSFIKYSNTRLVML